MPSVNSSVSGDRGRPIAIWSDSKIEVPLAALSNVDGCTPATRSVSDVDELQIDVLNQLDTGPRVTMQKVESVFLEGIPFILDLIEGAFGGRHGEGFGGLESPDFGIWKH